MTRALEEGLDASEELIAASEEEVDEEVEPDVDSETKEEIQLVSFL